MEDRRMKVSVLLVVLVLAAAWPAFADHMMAERGDTATASAEPASPGVAPENHDLDLELKVGHDHFRLGGRLFGRSGVAGAWLNGQVRPWGFSLDGRVQQDARRGYDFKFDADVRDWLRTVRRWMLETPSPGERL